MIRLFIRRYATATYRNKKSSLTSSVDAKDFAARNMQLMLKGNDKVYPLLHEVPSNQSRSSTVMRINQFHSKYHNVQHAQESPDRICIQGRISSIRRAGKKLIFIDVVQDMKKLQVVVKPGSIENYDEEQQSLLREGDHISVVGMPWRTKRGELGIMASHQVDLVSPCLHPLPTNLKDDATRMHNRVVDMAVNPQLKNTLKVRATVIRYIREFLDSRDFTEVNTPLISSQSGGAIAKPFTTFSNALDSDGKSTKLAFRIAPELWLKRLIIGGLDKVYELGPCFRNEGIDATHNPEFYTCEFYQSFADLETLIQMSESMLSGVIAKVIEIHGSNEHLETLAINFGQGFKRIDFIPELEKQTSKKLPEVLTRATLQEFCKSLGLEVDPAENEAGLLDQLASEYLEPLCQNVPTVIMNHPHIMSPLAKSSGPVSRRFELFINGREYINAYEEENSPQTQLENFRAQSGDNDTVVDQGYVDALEWGLPPTGGWGLGIDRLVMLLTDSKRIDNVLPFGTVKTVNYQ